MICINIDLTPKQFISRIPTLTLKVSHSPKIINLVKQSSCQFVDNMANYANIFVFLLISLLNSNLTSGAALNTITDTTGAGNFQYLGKYEHHYPSPSSSISSVNTSSNDIAENKAEVDSTTITAATSFYFLSQNSVKLDFFFEIQYLW